MAIQSQCGQMTITMLRAKIWSQTDPAFATYEWPLTSDKVSLRFLYSNEDNNDTDFEKY